MNVEKGELIYLNVMFPFLILATKNPERKVKTLPEGGREVKTLQ